MTNTDEFILFDQSDQLRAYLAIGLIFAAVALSLAWLQVEDVISPAASQIVSLGIGMAVLVAVLRILELYAGRVG